MKKLISFIIIISVVTSLGSFIYKTAKGYIFGYLLKNYAQYSEAVIIDELNYKKNRSLNSGFSYSYLFTIKGKKYKNNAQDSTLKIGDKIEIEYYKNDPSINKPLHPKE